MKEFLVVYWPWLFTLATIALGAVVDAAECVWPPKLDLSGKQLAKLFSTPVFLCTAVPAVLVTPVLAQLARGRLSRSDRASLVWWSVNLFWFHTGCDILSGYYQIMPVFTELYTHMNTAHGYARWHPERAPLDCAYGLELFFEAPFAAWLVYLFWKQDKARYLVELWALGVQFAGTVVYYLPALMRGEFSCWLSYADRACGSVWIMFPAYVFWRSVKTARSESTGKKQKHK
ncbi:unnamed protein product [Effrenium voratum]|uniref:EXPERA domain-containing protein n=1 Tax=Effrenium voratum TaxID=2562239 RepID=A0AA36N8U4_9DINO|nr:unnamed protein product [Effrenium voratum]CAJ1403280.1 unnamed protein product [Effrenium voratum]